MKIIILLVIMYGRGEKSIAQQLGCDVEEAKQIKDNVYTAFPRIQKFEVESANMVKSKGFVTTLWGRKRRLPDYNLPQYSMYYIDDDGQVIDTMKVPDSVCSDITEKLSSMYWKKREEYIEKLRVSDKIKVVDNNSSIAAAGRQIINSRVQGSASDMSKKALIKIHNDVELKNRKVKIIIPVHDEILIETPLRYAKSVKKIFANDMETAARDRLTIPISCDVVSANGWYHDELDLHEVLGDLPDV